MLLCDNGSEFTGPLMDLWAYRNGVKIDFSRPGKPTDNAFVESFNGAFRAECLDTNWFQSLPEASQIAASRDLAETETGRELTIEVVQIFRPFDIPVCLISTGTEFAGQATLGTRLPRGSRGRCVTPSPTTLLLSM